MDSKVTDALQPTSADSRCYEGLKESLQVLLAKEPVLTLVLFVGEALERAAPDARRAINAGMDDVEKLLIACFRRSDMIVRCGEESCAAILQAAEADGALRAVHRFQRLLGCWPPLKVALRVGVAAAPEQAQESQALLALALKPYLRIFPVPDAEQGCLPRMDGLVESKPAMVLALSKADGAQERPSKVAAHLKQALALSTAATFGSDAGQPRLNGGDVAQSAEMLARARARALGVPYIAPPQRIPSSVRNLLSVDVMRQLQCLPIGRDRSALTVALADPTNRGILQRLEQLTGLTIFPVMTDPDALESLAQPPHPPRPTRPLPPSPSVGPAGD